MNQGKLVEVKGSRSGLRLIMQDESDFSQLAEALGHYLQEHEGFLRGATVTVEVGHLLLSASEVQWLTELLEETHGIRMAAFTREGAPAPELTRLLPQPDPQLAAGENQSLEGQERSRMPSRPVRDAGPATRVEGGREIPTLFLYRNLRSGHRVNYRGNVVVIGDVNPGAEIVAEGDIIVIGTLRGIAHAGAGGDEEAVVVALRLLPMQLRIAQVISRPPDEAMDILLSRWEDIETRSGSAAAAPEAARLQDGRVVIDSYSLLGES